MVIPITVIFIEKIYETFGVDPQTVKVYVQLFNFHFAGSRSCKSFV